MLASQVYTTVGSEIARVTVVNMQGQAVLEQLIRPNNVILDHNTRFSGIDESDLAGVTTRLSDVHEQLRKLMSSRSILIGHSLESDFVALKAN